MSPNALKEFRTTDGWELSADAYYTYKQSGKNLGISTNTLNSPIFEIVFSQTGLSAGASLKGAKYSRLIR
jgi:lipid-binding SYLF domain-containing protein